MVVLGVVVVDEEEWVVAGGTVKTPNNVSTA